MLAGHDLGRDARVNAVPVDEGEWLVCVAVPFVSPALCLSRPRESQHLGNGVCIALHQQEVLLSLALDADVGEGLAQARDLLRLQWPILALLPAARQGIKRHLGDGKPVSLGALSNGGGIL